MCAKIPPSVAYFDASSPSRRTIHQYFVDLLLLLLFPSSGTPGVEIKLTDVLSKVFCFRLLSATSSSLLLLFVSLCCSSSNLSLACCLCSISALRFCAIVDEDCDNVPNRPPNSRWPRLRSSAAATVFLSGLEGFCAAVIAADRVEVSSWTSRTWLSR